MVELKKKGSGIISSISAGQSFVLLAAGTPIPVLTINSAVSFPDMITAGSPVLSSSITVT